MKSSNATRKGFRIRHFYAFLMIFGCLLVALIFQSTCRIKARYEEIIDDMNDYAACTKSTSEFRMACNYLSQQVQFFCLTRNLSYVDNYFYELNDSKRRDVAVQIISMTHEDDFIGKTLMRAYEMSEKLIKTDFYAMKLIIEANSIDFSLIPEELYEINLNTKDKSLSSEQKMLLAQNMLFSKEYGLSLQAISETLTSILIRLSENHASYTSGVNDIIDKHFALQIMMEVIMMVVCVLLYTLLVIFVFIPLQRNYASILKNKKMPVSGSREVIQIAKAYNGLYEKNQVTTQVLKHKAEHDNLTGLINREAFCKIKEILASMDEPVAYLIIDIDFFKHINDDFGHPTGDLVLKKVAEILKEQFRASDYIIRTGGDEFVVVMTKFYSLESVTAKIKEKVQNINEILQSGPSGLPIVTVSVGVALSSCGYNDSLENNADVALYNVKGNSRCGVAFYDEIADEIHL